MQAPDQRHAQLAKDRDVFVSAADLAGLFADVAAMFRERCAGAFLLQGHKRVVLLLGELPGGELFWLIAPAHEGRFLAVLPWSEAGEALFDLDDRDWPEVQRWKMIAKLPINLTGKEGQS